MKYVKEVVTKEDGRLMEYYWFKENPVGADIIRPKNAHPDAIHQQDESPHTGE